MSREETRGLAAVHVFNAYHFLRTWRFEPARAGGEPVGSIDAVTISLHSGG